MSISSRREFMTEERFARAIDQAEKLAEQKPWLSGPQCAEGAVREVFGEWLLDWSASIRPDCLPLYFQLIGRIEKEIGVHRCLDRRSSFPEPPIPQRSPVPGPRQAKAAQGASVAMVA